MKNFIATIVCFSCLSVALAQTGSISGRVIDSETLEGLPFANVFITNTTLGVSTSVDGDFDLRNIPIGSSEVTFSFVGYQPYYTRVVIKDGETVPLNIRLVPLKEQLSEVEIKAKRDKNWERQIRKFEKVFLGTDDLARLCKIENPFIIDFTESADKFTASASAPIIVENRALGYKLNFHLKTFALTDASYSIVGSVQFIELDAASPAEAKAWAANRRDAYTGSARHFFSSLLEGNYKEQGFEFYTDKTNGNRLGVFGKDLNRSIFPYENTNTLVQPGSSIYDKKLMLNGRIEVHYLHDGSGNYVYKDIGHAISWMDIKNGMVSVNTNGIMLNPLDVLVSGDMAVARVSNMLPLDYQPSRTIVVRTKDQIAAEKLFESVYIQTSKPFYYPGEIIWLKAYMHYKNRSAADTLSRILYLDMVNADQQVVKSKVLKIENGSASGSFYLPLNLPKGIYAINAYTNWMKNYGTESFGLKVFPVLDIYERITPSPAKETTGSRELEVSFDKEKYTTRDLVKVSIELKDELDRPLHADMAVSITDISQVPVPSWNSNDIMEVMPALANIRISPGKFNHRIEHGATLRGTFIDSNGKAAKTQLTFLRGALEDVRQVTTDERGAFNLYDLDIPDSLIYRYQARRRGDVEGTINVLPGQAPFSEFRANKYVIPVTKESTVQRVISKYEVPDDVIMLEEVEIKSTKLEDVKQGDKQNAYGKSDLTLKGDDIARYGTIESLLREKAPGFFLNFDGTHWLFSSLRSATMNGSPREPFLSIDNRQVIPGPGETVGDYLMQLQVDAIERIEVSTVAKSYVGANNGYGLVAVYMKRGTAPVLKNSFNTIMIKGYETPVTFMHPDYGNQSQDHSAVDVRSTLYWNSKLNVDKAGHSEFTFYTSDIPGRYRIVIEGVTPEGKPLHSERLVEVGAKN